jgi:hypothetical protein
MVDSMNEIQEVVHDLNLLQTKKIQTKKNSLFQLNKIQQTRRKSARSSLEKSCSNICQSHLITGCVR